MEKNDASRKVTTAGGKRNGGGTRNGPILGLQNNLWGVFFFWSATGFDLRGPGLGPAWGSAMTHIGAQGPIILRDKMAGLTGHEKREKKKERKGKIETLFLR